MDVSVRTGAVRALCGEKPSPTIAGIRPGPLQRAHLVVAEALLLI